MRLPTLVLAVLIVIGASIGVGGVGPAAAATPVFVQSDVTTDTTWTPQNDPYRIIGDIEVADGVTLTIEPGTTVEFADGKTLTVKGTLIAEGTAANQITITNTTGTPGGIVVGTWSRDLGGDVHTDTGTLIFEDVHLVAGKLTVNSGDVHIRDSTLEQRAFYNHGTAAVTIRNTRLNDGFTSSDGTVNDITITNSVFDGGGGFHLGTVHDGWYPAVNAANITITHTEFRGTGVTIPDSYGNTVHGLELRGNTLSYVSLELSVRDGILAENRVTGSGLFVEKGVNLTVTDNTITENSGTGLKLGSAGNVTIAGNQVTGNAGTGIVVTGQTPHRVRIRNNTVTGNNGNGIVLDGKEVHGALIANNTVLRNDGAGLHFKSGSNLCCNKNIPSTITANTLARNENGLVLDTYEYGAIPSTVIENAILKNNASGIVLKTDGFNITRNNVYANGVGLSNPGGHSADAEYNYWGASSGPYIASVNPEGDGNRVESDGSNVDVFPFATTPISGVPTVDDLPTQLSGPIPRFDINNNGEIEFRELSDGAMAYANGELTFQKLTKLAMNYANN